MKKISAAVLLIVLLSACQSTYIRGTLPTGTVFHLNHEIEFHPLQVAIYIQKGRIVQANSIDDYRPNCTLEVKHKLAHVQIFRQDSFKIDKVRYEVAGGHFSPLHTHSLSLNGASRYPEYITEIFLHSSLQPNLYKLTCQHLEEPENARHLTLDEIQNTLGGLITISSPR